MESVVNREVDDLITVIEIFREEVAPFLFNAARRMDMAQHLFAGMVVGQIPREFEESHMMAATGWSWQALQATPIDVVQKMALYLAVSDARNTQGSLDFTECEKEEPYDNR